MSDSSLVHEHIGNESETAKDASAILNHPIKKEEFLKSQSKVRMYSEIIKDPTPVYDNYENCIKILQEGITATKFNFSNH